MMMTTSRSEMNVAAAKALKLLGQSTVWHGHGGRALADVPDGVLKQARRFFKDRNHEEPSARLQEQIEAITLVLADREENSPQERLAL
jgi:hypothetical protein